MSCMRARNGSKGSPRLVQHNKWLLSDSPALRTLQSQALYQHFLNICSWPKTDTTIKGNSNFVTTSPSH